MKSTGSPCAYYDPPGGGFNGATLLVYCLFIDRHLGLAQIRNSKHEILNKFKALNSKQGPSGKIVAIGVGIVSAPGV